MLSAWMMIVVAVASAAAEPAPVPSDRWESVRLEGRAVLLADALKAGGMVADTEVIAKQVVVATEEGAIRPLLSDDASRALFVDDRLRDRRVEIQGRARPGNPYVQVISFRVEENGKLASVEYHCDVCAIDVRAPQICPCCQGPMELRMSPEGP